MPVTSSAQKALRRDRRREVVNRRTRENMRLALKRARQAPSPEALTRAYSALDTAAKKGVIHANTASRLKSRLSAAMKRVSKTPVARTRATKKITPKIKKPTKVVKNAR